VSFGAHSVLFDATRSDDDGRWTYRGILPEVVAAYYTPTDPAQPEQVQYRGFADACFPAGAKTLRMDLTLWRAPSMITRGLLPSCSPNALGFEGGLLALAYALGDAMGQPLEFQHASANGDVVQTTSTGLAYENADGWFFTDGNQTWTLGPDGGAEQTQ
jgi:hypothetical protein